MNPPSPPLRALINLINQLNPTNLTLPQLIKTLQHTLEAARANLGRVNSQLLAGEKLSSKLPESLAELEVLRLRGDVHAAEELEGFAGDGVAEGGLGRYVSKIDSELVVKWDDDDGMGLAHLVLNISPLMLGIKQIRHRTSLGPNSLRADLRRLALGNAVEDLGQLVASVLANLLRALRVVVVESLRGTERLDEPNANSTTE